MKLLWLCLLLAACSPSPPPAPLQGQWTCFQCSGMILNSDGEFVFPQSNGAIGYIFTSVSGNPIGKMVTLDYTVSGYPPTTFVPTQASGSGPATFRLFMWEKGDNLSCNGSYAMYRWWSVLGAVPVVFGEGVLNSQITPDRWTDCLGINGAVSGGGITDGFNQAVGNLLGIGITCGAEFYGHGCYAKGPATFKINSFTVGP